MDTYALEDLVLGDLLRKRAQSHGKETFLKFREGELTYGEVDETTDRLAAGFLSHGIQRHDHVALMMSNCPELIYVVFALARIGAVAVPINPAYKGELLHHVLKTSDTRMLVVDQALLDDVARLEDTLPKLESIAVRTDERKDAAFDGLHKPAVALRSLFASGGEKPGAPVRFSDLQAIMFTSGTTGPSKGVMCPHANALTCALDSLKVLAYKPGETIFCPLPVFHAAALWDGVMTAMLGGLSIAITERFSASRFWDDVRHFDAQVAMGVFSMIPILLSRPESPDDKNHPLRAFYVGKSSLDETFNKRFGVRAVESYTSTEAGIPTYSPYGSWRPGSCGQANEENFHVAIVDEHDREVGPGEAGEIVLRPKRPFVITTGYYNFPEATAKCFRNLWFHTGDRAYRDQDGYFFFVDRVKDSIRRRGENISAFELERVVNHHEAVLESAAFGVPSEIEEDDVKVAVVLRRGAMLRPEELEAWCQERLPAFMVPRYIEFVGDLPKTPTGKIAKHELRRMGEKGVTAQTWDGATSRGVAQAKTSSRKGRS